MSQTPPKGTPTDVIHVGFSFAVYKNRPHHMWELLLRRLSGKVIVAPAGNQGRGHERYPAALHRQHPTSVIGVGSLQPGLTNRSKFSNYGKWVACSAVGEDVESTFLEVDMPPEENPRLPHNYAQNSWALWNGTSFSAPKVAAVMAALMRQGQAPAQAWTTLTGVTNRRSSSLGHLFQV
jgi:subtilisin family serine protease